MTKTTTSLSLSTAAVAYFALKNCLPRKITRWTETLFMFVNHACYWQVYPRQATPSTSSTTKPSVATMASG